MGHNWSGWPGAFCLRCGAEHALETAIAQGWFQPDQDSPGGGKWTHEAYKNYVHYVDGICGADLSAGERLEAINRVKALAEAVELLASDKPK